MDFGIIVSSTEPQCWILLGGIFVINILAVGCCGVVELYAYIYLPASEWRHVRLHTGVQLPISIESNLSNSNRIYILPLLQPTRVFWRSAGLDGSGSRSAALFKQAQTPRSRRKSFFGALLDEKKQ